ncbi:MAG: hypothetical protein ABI440_09385 [Casimicrobiaceae bacterium]
MSLRIAAALSALFLCAPTFGADLSVACKPVLASMEKTIAIDHATTTTAGTETVKGVTVGGSMYFQSRGTWRKSPMTAQAAIAQSRENLKNAKEYSCTPLPDSVVDGVAVANFATHMVSDDATNDGAVAIDTRSGLAIRVENNLKTGAANAPHYVTQYTYGGIKAPM